MSDQVPNLSDIKDRYIALLERELERTTSFMRAHGQRPTQADVDEGERLRALLRMNR